MKIEQIKGRKILNSRGHWTTEAKIILKDQTEAKASVPEGASLGESEAKSIGAKKAVENINSKIAPKLKGMKAENQNKIDKVMLDIDATKDKSNLGVNAILPVSIANLKAQAKSQNIPLWKLIKDKEGLKNKTHNRETPFLLFNLINGGLHAGNNLDFQEYLVVPQKDDINKSLEIGKSIYSELKGILSERVGVQATNVGDEGGFSPSLSGNFEPLSILKETTKKMGIENEVKFSLDIAANDLASKKSETEYNLSENTFTTSGLQKMYSDLSEHFSLLSIEDPFVDSDFNAFTQLKKQLGKVKIVGDDLTTTNKTRIKEAAQKKAIDAVIIKPNQIGTITETYEAINAARKNDIKIIISHRSGETNDSFIADLAWGASAFGLKAGAPARGERVTKYNRLLEIDKKGQS